MKPKIKCHEGSPHSSHTYLRREEGGGVSAIKLLSLQLSKNENSNSIRSNKFEICAETRCKNFVTLCPFCTAKTQLPANDDGEKSVGVEGERNKQYNFQPIFKPSTNWHVSLLIFTDFNESRGGYGAERNQQKKKKNLEEIYKMSQKFE